MYDVIHRYAPKSPVGRTAVAIVASLIGTPAFVLGVVGLSGNVAAGVLFLLLSAITLTIAGQLTRGVVRQANAAPTANPSGEQLNEPVETPVETLRRRYAEGELSDKEFQHRLDQLLETEESGTQTDRERVFE